MLKLHFFIVFIAILAIGQGKKNQLSNKDVDGLCVALHCGLQSAACFTDGNCGKVIFLFSII
jgi:hypothetical protein